MKTVIITGASSGLGEEYVKKAVALCECDEIWVMARRVDRLEKLKEKYGDKIVPVKADLISDSFPAEFEKMLCGKNPDITGLINCAGFGTLGDFKDEDYSTQARMVDLNCRAVTVITNIALKYMKKGAFILNVCSIASFAPNPRMTTYCSTKAYILSFTKSLHYELKPYGINVCAVCPGPMDTEFLAVAGIEKGKSKTFDTLPRCNPEKTAEMSLRAAMKGRCVCTPMFFYKFYRVVAKLLPHSAVMPMSKA